MNRTKKQLPTKPFFTRFLEQRLIAHDVSNPKLGQARLLRSEQLTRSTQLEIFLSNDEPVARLRHDAESFFSNRGLLVARQQYAITLLGAPTNAAAQLVKLRQSEAFRVLDDHYRCIGNVNADFDHRRRHQDLGFTGDK